MSNSAQHFYEFGPFRLDRLERVLFRAEQPLTLTPKAFDLLLALVERHGHVIEKEELLDTVWPETVVEESNLTHHISVLRKTLGESAGAHPYIETIPRRGYRFVSAVKESKGANVAPVISPLPATPDIAALHDKATIDEQMAVGLPLAAKPAPKAALNSRSNPWLRRIFLVAGLLVMAVAIPLYLSWKSRGRMPKVTRSTQVTHDGRMKRDAVVTDGARIYFSAQQGVKIGLAQIASAGGETVPLHPDLPNANLLAISPDRSKLLIGRFEASAPECPLWIVPLTGGAPSPLGEVLAHAATWTPDGKWITYAKGRELFQVMNDGSGARKLLSATGRIDWPRWSPDGKRLRFTLVNAQTLLPELWEAIDGANPQPLLPGWNKPEGACCGNWSADGKYFVFESVRNRVSDIWALREESGLFAGAERQPVQLTFGPMDFHAPVPSADGNQILVIGKQHRGELMRYDANTRQFASYLSGLSAEGVTFAVDGEWISYVAYPEGDLWRSKVDGSQRLQLSFAPLRVRNPRWSPDGKRIVFQGQLPGKPWQIHVVSSEGGNPQLLSPEERDERDASWSPDGNALVFSSRIAPGDRELHLLDLQTNRVSQLPDALKMYSSRWSPDGRYIAALPNDARKLLLFDCTTQKWEDLVQTNVAFPAWSRDSRHIYFVNLFGDEPGIKRVRITDHKVEWVASLKELRLVQTYFGAWFGLGPDDSPLVLRDVGIQDIYALDLQSP